MKIENVTSSRNTLRSVFSCRNSRYGANQETSEVNIWKLYFSNSIENRMRWGGIRIKNVIVFPIEALPCQCAFKKFETHIFFMSVDFWWL